MSTTEQIAEFMVEYEHATVSNLDIPSERLFQGVGFVLVPFSTGILVASIRAITPHRGDGTRGLKWLLALADKHRVVLLGAASAKPGDVPTTADLMVWYEKHGFTMLTANGTMRYIGQEE